MTRRQMDGSLGCDLFSISIISINLVSNQGSLFLLRKEIDRLNKGLSWPF